MVTGLVWPNGILAENGKLPEGAAKSPRGAAKGRALDLADFYRIEAAGSPAISPDGRYVAFVRTYTLEEQNRRQSEIWLVSVDGAGSAKKLTPPDMSASSPRWSPDGKLLAFSASRRASTGSGGAIAQRSANDNGSIWFLHMDQPGSEPFQMPGVTGMPVFSPDNRWIAFTKRTPPSEKKQGPQYASDVERKIDERFKGRIYDWMDYRFDQRGYLPDPRDPAASPSDDLYIVSRDGGAPSQLTKLGVDVRSPVWRPDSTGLAFTANSHQRDEYVYERADLWTVTLGGETKRLTDDGYNYSSPAWSPDGKSLAFRREQSLTMVIEAKQDHGAAVDVYRMPVAGAMTNLTADWDLIPGEPLWSADGSQIYFSGGVGGANHMFRVASEGGTVKQVTEGDRVLVGFSFTAAFDRVAYASTDSTHPMEIFCARIDGSGERRLSTLNDAATSELSLSAAQRVQYRSKDGTMVEGWFIPPVGFDPANNHYPLIVSMHGGPHMASGNSFDYEFQLWAARGYAVFYCNPRGSTGYGEKFLWGTWGGWGTVDYEDVMAGVDYVLGHYPVDPKRMGITGYSYGGFLTDWTITQTSRFAAAVAGAGISNWVSDYGTADIPRTKESEFYGPPWEAKSNALLVKFSPITHVANVSTPTLFVHGESDMRVPIEQGEQMYRALKKLRVPAKFIRYPESFHGGWTPWNTLHRFYHELLWWDEYLSATPKGQARGQ